MTFRHYFTKAIEQIDYKIQQLDDKEHIVLEKVFKGRDVIRERKAPPKITNVTEI